MKKLAIVGTKLDYDQLEIHAMNWFRVYNKPNIILYGSNKDIDYKVKKFAKENGINSLYFKADLSYGKLGFAIRNTEILKEATHVLIFKKKGSKDTDMIKKSLRKMKENVSIIEV